MHELSDFWPFWTAFIALVMAGCGFPIPEELPTIGAGIWVASHPELGELRWLILPVCYVGVLISDIILYGFGRWSGRRLLDRPWVKRIIPQEKWEETEKNYDRYGVKVLLLIRWVPAIRSPMFISAGIMRLPFARFILADLVALMFGHGLLFFLAYWFGDSFKELIERAEHGVDRLKPLLILLALAVGAGFLLYHFMRRPVSTADPQELPIIGEKVAAKIEHHTEDSAAAPPPASTDGAPAERPPSEDGVPEGPRSGPA